MRPRLLGQSMLAEVVRTALLAFLVLGCTKGRLAVKLGLSGLSVQSQEVKWVSGAQSGTGEALSAETILDDSVIDVVGVAGSSVKFASLFVNDPECRGSGLRTEGVQDGQILFKELETIAAGDGKKVLYYTAQLSSGSTRCLPTGIEYEVKTRSPQVTVSAPTSETINRASTVRYTVSYSTPAWVTLASRDLSLVRTGTADCSGVAINRVSNSARQVVLNNCTGDGSVKISIARGSATAKGSGTAVAGEAIATQAVSVDNSPPAVLSIAPTEPVSFNGAASFKVKFSEAVTGLSIGNLGFVTTGTLSGPSVTSISPTTADEYVVGVSLGTGVGTVALKLSVTTGVKDSAGNLLSNPFLSGSPVTVPSPPSLTLGAPDRSSINQAGKVVFPVSFAGFSSILLSPDLIAVSSPNGVSCTGKAIVESGASSRNIEISGCSGNGSLSIKVLAGAATNFGLQTPASPDSAPVLVDNQAPTVVSIAPINNQSLSATEYFDVVFSEAVMGLDTSIFALTTSGSNAGASVSSVAMLSDTKARVLVNLGSGPGTLRLDVASIGNVRDGAQNGLASVFRSGSILTIPAAPTILISAPSKPLIKGSDSVSFTVSYTGASSVSLSSSDVSVLGSASCGSKGVSGSGSSTRLVTLSGCSGDGDVKISIAANSAQNGLAQAAAAGPSGLVTVDTTPPTVVSIAPLNSQSLSATEAFDVTFSESVVGVLPANFRLTTSGSISGASVQTVSMAAGNRARVMVGLGTGYGSIRLDLTHSTDSVLDSAGNSLSGGFNSGAELTVPNAPTLVLSAPSKSLINSAGSLDLTVVYTGASSISLTEADLSLVLSGDAACSSLAVSGSGSSSRTVTIAGCSGNGDVRLRIAASSASNGIAQAASAGPSSAFVVDNGKPSVVSISPLNAQSISAVESFDVTFSEPVGGVGKSNFALTTTGSIVGASVLSVSETAADRFRVSVAMGSGTGSVRLDLNSIGSIVDVAGNALAGPFVAGSSITVPETPTIAIAPPSQTLMNASASVSFPVLYTNASSVSLTAADVSVQSSGDAVCSDKQVSGSGTTTRTVTLSRCSGNGSLKISVAANTASNGPAVVGAAGPSQVVTVDTTAPAVLSIAPFNAQATSGLELFDVFFSEGVSGVSSANFSLTTTGSIAGASVSSISMVAPDHAQVRVGLGSGNGTVRLNLVLASDGVESSIKDVAGNALVSGFSTGSAISIPDGPALAIGAPSQAFVNGSDRVEFLVTYSGASTISLAAADVSLQGSANCGVKTVTGSGLTTRTVSLSSCSGDGEVRISIAANSAQNGPAQAGSAGPSAAFTVDTTAPTVVSIAPVNSQSLSATENFDVTFSENVTGVTGANFSLATTGSISGASITGVSMTSASRAQVAVGMGSGTGTLRLDLSSLGAIRDRAGNPLVGTFTSGSSLSVPDKPTLAIGSPSKALIKGSESVSFSLTYTGASAVSLTASDVTLQTSGTAACSSKVVSGSGTSARTVTLSSCSGEGDVKISIAANTAQNGLAQADSVGPSAAFAVDAIAPASPSLTSISPASPSSNNRPTVAGTAEAGSTVSLYSGANCSGTAIGSATAAGGNYSIQTSALADGTHTIRAAATDAAGNVSACSGVLTSYVISTESVSTPVITSVSPGSPTNNVRPTFVGTADPNSIVKVYSDASCSTLVAGGATASEFAAGIQTSPLGNPLVRGGVFKFYARATNSAGTISSPCSSGTGTYIVDVTAPSVLSIAPVNAQSVSATESFDVTFSENVTDFAASNFSTSTTGSMAGVSVASVSRLAGNQVRVVVNMGTGAGTVRLNLASIGAIKDLAGNALSAPFSSGSVISVPEKPTLTISSPSKALVRSSDSVSYLVTYTGAPVVTLTSSDVTLQTSGTAACSSKVVSGSGTSDRTVTLSSCSGDGDVRISVAANTAQNGLAQAGAVGPTAPFSVDNTSPKIVKVEASATEIGAGKPVQFRVSFTEKVSAPTLRSSDIVVRTEGSHSGATISALDFDGNDLLVTLLTGSGSGVLGIDIPAPSTFIFDLAGNPLEGFAPGSSSTSVKVLDSTDPDRTPAGTGILAYSSSEDPGTGLGPYTDSLLSDSEVASVWESFKDLWDRLKRFIAQLLDEASSAGNALRGFVGMGETVGKTGASDTSSGGLITQQSMDSAVEAGGASGGIPPYSSEPQSGSGAGLAPYEASVKFSDALRLDQQAQQLAVHSGSSESPYVQLVQSWTESVKQLLGLSGSGSATEVAGSGAGTSLLGAASDASVKKDPRAPGIAPYAPDPGSGVPPYEP